MDRVLKQLEAEHVVICQHGKGVFVSPLSEQRRFALIFPSNIYDDQYLSQFWALLHGAAMTQTQAQGDDLRTFYGCPDGDDVSAANAGLVEFLKSKRVDAILTAGVVGANLDWLRQWDKPIASLSNAPVEYGVTVNPKREITLGIESLAAQGCRSIAVVTLDHLVSGAASQMLHLRQTCEKAGLKWTPDLVWCPDASEHGLSQEEIGMRIIARKVEAAKDAGNGLPDGLFIPDDTIAHGVLIGLLKAGIQLRHDVKITVVSNKGSALLRPFHRDITRIELDPAEIVSEMLDLLNKLLAGQTPRRKIREVGLRLVE